MFSQPFVAHHGTLLLLLTMLVAGMDIKSAEWSVCTRCVTGLATIGHSDVRVGANELHGKQNSTCQTVHSCRAPHATMLEMHKPLRGG